jgi:ribose 5-phosphate isomerase
MTNFERALQFVTNGSQIGLGSGRAASAFVRLLGERVRSGALHVYGGRVSGNDFRLVDERHRGGQADGRARESNYEPVPEGA